jgi:transketolase
VALAIDAQKQLVDGGIHARVVSMPCWELFEEQDAAYRDSVLIPGVRCRVSIEAGVTLGWSRWIGDHGAAIGIDGQFGASGPYKDVYAHFGITVENVVQQTRTLVEQFGGVRA